MSSEALERADVIREAITLIPVRRVRAEHAGIALNALAAVDGLLADLAAARAREQRLRERTREFLLWLDFDAESVDTQERRKELDAALADQPAADEVAQ